MPQKENWKDKDLKLQKDIEEVLKNDKNLSGYDINVRVVKGKIFLQGIVDTLSEINHVQKLVQAVEGAGELENNLTISTDGAVDDKQIYMEVRQELESDPRLRDTQLKVLVNKGEVTLMGKVESMDKKRAACEAAGKAMGVKQVLDHIIVPKEAETDDADLVNEIRRIFAAGKVDSDRIKVTAKNGVVSLEGKISVKERNRALEAAAKVPGVKKVNAYLVDTDKGEMSRAARAAAEIQQAFADDLSINKIPLKIFEKEGHLVLEGAVPNVEQKRIVDEKLHSLMQEFGRELIAVENKIRVESQ